MQGKAPVFASRPLAHAIDKLSKNCLLDFVADMARAELGEDAPDSDILNWLRVRIAPTQRARGDKPIDLEAARVRCAESDARWLAAHPHSTTVPA